MNNEWSRSRLVCRGLKADVWEREAVHGWRYLGQAHMGRDRQIQTQGSSPKQHGTLFLKAIKSQFITVAAPSDNSTEY